MKAMMRRRWLVSRAVAAAGVLLAGVGGCGSSGEDEGRRTVVLLEVGGPVERHEVDSIAAIVVEELVESGNTVEVLRIDGPNADVATSLRLPGLDAQGALDTEANNRLARRDVAMALRGEIEEALLQAFSSGPDFGQGRDLLGAVARAAEGGPDRLVLVSTSGGVHRVEDVDFLDEIPEPTSLDLSVHTVVEIYGIGDVPLGGEVPSREFTNAVVDYWQRSCMLWAPADCEVIR